MTTFGVPSSALQQNTACPVRGWQSAVAWIQQHLTKANAGPRKGNHDGHQQTVFRKFCRPQAQRFKILPNLLMCLIPDVISFLAVYLAQQATMFYALWFFIGQL